MSTPAYEENRRRNVVAISPPAVSETSNLLGKECQHAEFFTQEAQETQDVQGSQAIQESRETAALTPQNPCNYQRTQSTETTPVTEQKSAPCGDPLTGRLGLGSISSYIDNCTEETEEREETEETEDAEERKEYKEPDETVETEECTAVLQIQDFEEKDAIDDSVKAYVDSAIRCCDLRKEEESYEVLFSLARKLLQIANLLRFRFSPNLLKQIFDKWKDCNHSLLSPGKDYYCEFLAKMASVRYLPGDELRSALRIALTKPPPSAVKHLPPKAQNLACLCRELQNRSGEEAFYLGCRSAAKILGVAHTTVALWLKSFCPLGVIYPVSKGTNATASRPARSTRYRYVAKD